MTPAAKEGCSRSPSRSHRARDGLLVATVSELNVAPVKGLAIERRAEIDLGCRGVADNRRFYLIDATGSLVTGINTGICPIRFRMLIGLAGTGPHAEDSWIGRRLRVGDAVVRVGGPVPRCAVTTRSPETGKRDFDTLRTIKDYRGLRDRKHIDFGVYGDVEHEGRIRLGDAADLLET